MPYFVNKIDAIFRLISVEVTHPAKALHTLCICIFIVFIDRAFYEGMSWEQGCHTHLLPLTLLR